MTTFSEKWTGFRQFTRRVWALSAPYFRSDDKWKGRGLLLAIVLLNLGTVYMAVQFNDWYRVFYDALERKDQAVFWQQLVRFSYLAFGAIVIAVYKFYLTQLLEMRWRAWMTRSYLARWLSDHAFYQLELARFAAPSGAASSVANPDNPDQRIQEDINQFTSYTVSLTMGLLNSVVTLVSFIGILWALSGSFSFSLGASMYTVPGFMVWAAVAYSLVGSVLTHYIGRRQISLNFFQQRYEADFRHHMVRVREYSESIALDRGERVERAQLDTRFSAVLVNYLQLLKAQKGLIWFTSFFGQAAVVFPFVVAAPRFFSGAIKLGELIQISSAFGKVQESLSWFVDSYSTLAAWRATTDRLTSFEDNISAVAQITRAHIATPLIANDVAPTADSAGVIAAVPPTQGEPEALAVRDLTVRLPGGEVLLDHLSLRAGPGDQVLLKGPSGSGKSTLFRALAGIWPYASGRTQLPEQAMFIPQRPYFPDGTLRDALAYPLSASSYSDQELSSALTDALLPELTGRLDDSDAWGQKLSGGEQQRLAIARVLLKKPAWIFADEATSALDDAAETLLYGRLQDQVKSARGGLVSIAHRPSVAAFHSKQWQLEKLPDDSEARYTVTESALQPPQRADAPK